MKLFRMALPCVLFAGLTLSSVSFAENGVFPNRIVLGQSAALEGPAAALGQGMRLGLQAAFNEVNKRGGVNGRTIEMITYDDGYEPEKSIDNVKQLITDDKVFALIGAVGTPTSKATQPIALSAGVPFFGPFTGAGFLRDPSNDNVINVRGSYDQETEEWIKYLAEEVGAKKIAILYQDDSFGRAGLSGVQKAMKKRGMSLVAEGTYERNTVAVKSALLTIRKAKPDAVVMVGSYKPIAEFVKIAKRVKLKSKFVTISFVGSKALARELGKTGSGVIVSQVVPLPTDKSFPIISQYQNALKQVDGSAEPGFVSLEGYLVGRLMIEALSKIKGELTRDNLLSVVKSVGHFNIGGLQLSFGPEDSQGMDDIFLSVINENGTFDYVGGLSATLED